MGRADPRAARQSITAPLWVCARVERSCCSVPTSNHQPAASAFGRSSAVAWRNPVDGGGKGAKLPPTAPRGLLEAARPWIFGIGRTRARSLSRSLGVRPDGRQVRVVTAAALWAVLPARARPRSGLMLANGPEVLQRWVSAPGARLLSLELSVNQANILRPPHLKCVDDLLSIRTDTPCGNSEFSAKIHHLWGGASTGQA